MEQLIILIPAFNSAKTIAGTLASIQKQGEALRQISAVYLADDCSEDNTIDVALESWKCPIPLRILAGEKNLGERGNLNRLITIIEEKIQWFFILHSDDIAKPNWLQEMLRSVNECSQNVASVCSSWDTTFNDGRVIKGEEKKGGRPILINGKKHVLQDTLRRGCWWHISGCAIRRSAFQNVGNFDIHLPQLGDWEWLLRCLEKGRDIIYIPKSLIVYQQTNDTVSAISLKKGRDILESLKIIKKFSLYLSRTQLCILYLQRSIYVLRRFLKALTHFRWNKCRCHFRTLRELFGALCSSQKN